MPKKRKGGSHGRRRQGPQAREATQASAPGPGGPAGPAAPPPGGLRWWERLEDGGRDRYERELEALRAAGFNPRPRPDHTTGVMHVDIAVPIHGTVSDLAIVYPALYPDFRFEVFARDLDLRRHRHPTTGALCLIDQGTINWRPASMLAADVIAEQLSKILAANASVGPYADESPAPEPLSMYFEYQEHSVLVLPPEAYRVASDRDRGRMTLALASAGRPLRGYVERIDGAPVGLPDLSRALRPVARVEIDWLRVAAPKGVNGTQIAAELEAAGTLRRPRPLSNGLAFELVGLLFEEEVEYRDVMGAGWAFLLRTRTRGGWSSELVRVERYDAGGQGARIRSIGALATKTIFQAGAGGLGAPTAHLLAQSRVGTLRIADGDVLGIGNAVRWPLGFAVAGLPKVLALRNLIAAHYPETRVEGANWFIGRPAAHDDEAWVAEALRGVDLVLDATAEIGVQQFLAGEARKRGIPFVMVEATPGGFGGIVARIEPEETGPCWLCLQHAIADGSIRPPIDARAGSLQLAGCSTPTFTGAAFDLVPLAAMGARLAAAALASPDGDSQSDWNVAVLFNREDDRGNVGLTPRWELHQLAVHLQCERHARAHVAA